MELSMLPGRWIRRFLAIWCLLCFGRSVIEVVAENVVSDEKCAAKAEKMLTPKAGLNGRPSNFGPFPSASTPKIIGVGYPKTATLSLQSALEQLNLTAVHGNFGYCPEHFRSPSTGNLSARINATCSSSLQAVADGVDAWIENLARFELPRVLRTFPNAKYILTVRDVETWFRSARRFFKGRKMGPYYFEEHFGVRGMKPNAWKDGFLNHTEKVKKLVPPQQLLVIDLTIGDAEATMKQICDFIEVPCHGLKVPHKHDTEEALERRAALKYCQGTAQDEHRRFAYITALSSNSSRRQDDLRRVQEWAFSLYRSGSIHDFVCIVLGELPPEEERQLSGFVKLWNVDPDSLKLPRAAQVKSVDEQSELLLDLMKLRAIMFKHYEALFFMTPSAIAITNIDRILEDFWASSEVFQVRRGFDVPLDTDFFLIKPKQVKRVISFAQKVQRAGAWFPERGWFSHGPFNFQNRSFEDWNFRGSAASGGLFLFTFFLKTSPPFNNGSLLPDDGSVFWKDICTARDGFRCEELRKTLREEVESLELPVTFGGFGRPDLPPSRNFTLGRICSRLREET